MGDSTENSSQSRRCGQIGEGEEDTITMEDALKEEDRLKEEASAVLGASDPENCSYSKITYHQESAKCAYDAVMAGMPVRKASALFGIPRSTLRDKLRRKCPVGKKPRTSLSRDEENEFTKWFVGMNRTGFSGTCRNLLDNIEAYLDQLGEPSPRFKNGNRPSRTWFYDFLNRHPELKDLFAKGLGTSPSPPTLPPTSSSVSPLPRALPSSASSMPQALPSSSTSPLPHALPSLPLPSAPLFPTTLSSPSASLSPLTSSTLSEVPVRTPSMEEIYRVLDAIMTKEGYIDRQAVYACATCTPNGNAGVCLACSNVCHEGHDLYELYTKRYFCCDCGNDKFPGKECKLEKDKGGMNSRNRYNHNFSGVYCTCRRPYPDHDDDLEDEMIQCIMCEDWFHGRHLKTSAPDEFVEMICHECMSKYPFLWAYNLELSYEATTKNVKSESAEMIDVVSTDQKIEIESHGNCTADTQKPLSEDSEDSKIPRSQPLPGTTESGPVDSTIASSSPQSRNSQTESSTVKRSNSSPSEESESLSKKPKLEPSTECEQSQKRQKDVCLLKSLEQRTSEFREHATFWPVGWRSKLCKCEECTNMYRDRDIEFLVDESDTVQAYEDRGNSIHHATVEEENEADMFAGLDRVAQIEVARGMQDLKSELAVFLQGFAREGKIVRETDIRDFFERMEQKRRRRLNTPQHNCH